jgi:hypothetical protein
MSTYSVYDIKIDNSLSFTPGPTAGYVLGIKADGTTDWVQGGGGATGATGATGASGVTQSLFEVYIEAGTTASNLTTETNWNTGATYSGTAITGTLQGQKYYFGNFMYEAIDDNSWVRWELDRKTPFITLTDSATISWSYPLGYNAKVTLTGQNRGLEIIGATNGDYGTLFITQDSVTASRINFGSNDKFASGTYSFGSTASIDVFTWVYDGTNYFWNFNKTFK